MVQHALTVCVPAEEITETWPLLEEACLAMTKQAAQRDTSFWRGFGLRRAWLLFADDDTAPRTTTTWDGENDVVSVGLGLSQRWARIESTLWSVVHLAVAG